MKKTPDKELQRLQKLTEIDRTYWEKGLALAGMDEVGRGPLAGPVVVGCVVMPPEPLLPYVNDSKKLSEKALELYDELAKEFPVDFDETGSIGKRYRREDEIGTPFCITVDFDTVGDENTAGDNCVTVRERDTMEQVRIPIAELKDYLREKLAY